MVTGSWAVRLVCSDQTACVHSTHTCGDVFVCTVHRQMLRVDCYCTTIAVMLFLREVLSYIVVSLQGFLLLLTVCTSALLPGAFLFVALLKMVIMPL